MARRTDDLLYNAKFFKVMNVSPAYWRASATVAVFLAVATLVAGVADRVVSTTSLDQNAVEVPSTAAAAPTGRYAGPVEKSKLLARELVAVDNLPGLSAAVAVDGEIVWAEGFGWTDVARGTAVTPLTRFRLGALSKPLTAFAAAVLYGRGLDLDAPVQRYVPAYPRRNGRSPRAN